MSLSETDTRKGASAVYKSTEDFECMNEATRSLPCHEFNLSAKYLYTVSDTFSIVYE